MRTNEPCSHIETEKAHHKHMLHAHTKLVCVGYLTSDGPYASELPEAKGLENKVAPERIQPLTPLSLV